MRNLTIIFLLIPGFLFSQINNIKTDKQLFEYINIYRVKNGVKPLKWDVELYKISVKHNDYLYNENKNLYGYTISHSHTNTYENVHVSTGIGGDDTCFVDFKRFCLEYYDFIVDLEDPTKYKTMIMLSVIYDWDHSKNHKINLLTDNKGKGSVSIYISDKIKLQNNKYPDFKGGFIQVTKEKTVLVKNNSTFNSK